MDKARQVWIDFKAATARGHHYGKTKFVPLFKVFLESSTFKADRFNRIQHIFDRYFSSFWKNYDIRDVDNKSFKRYLNWRCDFWRNWEAQGKKVPSNAKKIPGLTTLKSERQVLKQFLRWCVEDQQVLAVVPSISPVIEGWEKGRVNMKKTRGYPLDPSQFASIYEQLRLWALVNNDEPNWIHRFARLRLYYFVLITVSCLLRPGTEATNLRWKDLRIVKGKEGDQIALWDVLSGKKGARTTPAFSTYGGVKHILRWRAVCKQYDFGQDEDLVFPNWDGEVIPTHYMNRVLKRLLKKWGIEETHSGQSITLYTFRATAIARRITKAKWDVSQVASAANTSIATISSAYMKEWMEQDPDRWATTDPEQKHTYTNEEDRQEIEKLMSELGM
tara:strand:+ start:2196 stop:3362 length:1167 start_codon:yes stop_codon:yes gene_type:complete